MKPIDTCLQQEKKSKKTTLKSTLSSYYQVDRATLNKWLKYFCNNAFEHENDLKNRRKFTDLEVEKIKEKLGATPNSFWKKDLVKMAETDYKTIRDNVRLFPKIYGITEYEYLSLLKFPPKIAERIIKGLG